MQAPDDGKGKHVHVKKEDDFNTPTDMFAANCVDYLYHIDSGNVKIEVDTVERHESCIPFYEYLRAPGTIKEFRNRMSDPSGLHGSKLKLTGGAPDQRHNSIQIKMWLQTKLKELDGVLRERLNGLKERLQVQNFGSKWVQVRQGVSVPPADLPEPLLVSIRTAMLANVNSKYMRISF